MQSTVQQELNGSFGDIRQRDALRRVLSAVADRLSSQVLTAAGLAIATTTTKIRTTNLTKWLAGGSYQSLAGTDNAITLGTDASIAANQHNVVVIYGDNAGALSYGVGTPGASVAAVKFPTPPVNKAVIGFVMISAGASAFTGGTTALTGGTVTVVYTDTLGAFDGSVLLG